MSLLRVIILLKKLLTLTWKYGTNQTQVTVVHYDSATSASNNLAALAFRREAGKPRRKDKTKLIRIKIKKIAAPLYAQRRNSRETPRSRMKWP